MKTSTDSKRFLLTGARSYITLDLARQLSANGHKVFVAETSANHVCRYSNAVEKSFIIPSPRFETEKFLQQLSNIVEQNSIDVLIPVCEEIFYIAEALHSFPASCKVFTPSIHDLEPLHNKWSFTEKLQQHGFATPKTHLLRSRHDIEALQFSTPYILKACYCRASQKIIKVQPGEPPPHIHIEEHNPWIAQEWIDGERYCSFSVASNGKLLAHSTYPVEHAIKGSSCLTFRAVHNEEVVNWTKKLIAALNFTGQIAFDFIKKPGGPLYAIECNPRSTSGLHLFTAADRIDRAFLEQNDETIYPRLKTKKQLVIGMMLYGWQKPPYNQRPQSSFLRTLLSTKDIIFDRQDLKPFLCTPIVFARYWQESRKLRKNLPAVFTHDIEWNNEPAP